VIIAADGGKGKQGVVVPFFGGERRFYQGGAELAVQTGARLVPVFGTMNAKGGVVFDTCSPLERGGGSAQAQIERLTRAYAELVVARWPQVYHCLAWGHLARLLAATQRHAREG
jgi:lauroyl/myristoyl acyltransferase